MLPTVGRIVHVNPKAVGIPPDTRHDDPQCLAGIVTTRLNQDRAGKFRVQVFTGSGTPLSANLLTPGEGDTWHWPEREE